MSSIAPPATLKPPSVLAAGLPSPNLRVPAATVVSPRYALAPLRVSAPAPCLATVPMPEITPLYAAASLRSKTSAALLTISPVTEPVTPPSPNWSVPPVIWVPPVWMLSPDSTSVPAPFWTSLAAPEIAPA